LLLGNSVTLQNSSGALLANGFDDLVLTENGPFIFTGFLVDIPIIYDVSVLSQPVTPSQNCVVSNDIDTIAGVDVSNAFVNCAIDNPETIYSDGFE